MDHSEIEYAPSVTFQRRQAYYSIQAERFAKAFPSAAKREAYVASLPSVQGATAK